MLLSVQRIPGHLAVIGSCIVENSLKLFEIKFETLDLLFKIRHQCRIGDGHVVTQVVLRLEDSVPHDAFPHTVSHDPDKSIIIGGNHPIHKCVATTFPEIHFQLFAKQCVGLYH